MNKSRNSQGKFSKSATYVDVTCKNCNVVFNTRKKKKEFCNKKCRGEYLRRNTLKSKLKPCAFCGKETTNKKYCSEKCQYNGYKTYYPKSETIELQCIFCKSFFKKKIYKVKENTKYCSKKCYDEHKKILYSNGNHPSVGRIASDEERKRRSIVSTKLWQTEEYRKKMSDGIKLFVKTHGYYPGTDEISCKHRKETWIKNYGVDNCWKSREIRKKSEETCIRLYGKTSLELCREALNRNRKTSIEVIVENILLKNNINFIFRYRVPYKYSYKEYDFYLPTLNILIECDGDFWHANPIKYDLNNLKEVQRVNIKNDKIKNELAKQIELTLLRFWENDIKSINFEEKIIQTLKTYGTC